MPSASIAMSYLLATQLQRGGPFAAYSFMPRDPSAVHAWALEEDPGLAFRFWEGSKLVDWTPPPPGNRVRLPAAAVF